MSASALRLKGARSNLSILMALVRPILRRSVSEMGQLSNHSEPFFKLGSSDGEGAVERQRGTPDEHWISRMR